MFATCRRSSPIAVVLVVVVAAVCGGCGTRSASDGNGKAKALAEGGRYKIGRPYAIDGVWYHPRVDYAYDAVGIASWYGEPFHGRSTANGETYNMNALTAAHNTLPMPSLVEVTNLDNGRRVTLRVNDRGPFAHGRIIDISRRGAQLLGFQHQGTTKVRVRILAEESRRLAEGASVTLAEADPPPAPAVSPPLAARPPAASSTSAPRTGADVFVQAGAFADSTNAHRAGERLAAFGDVQVAGETVNGRRVFRVRLGPFGSDGEADRTRLRAVAAGFTNSRVVYD